MGAFKFFAILFGCSLIGIIIAIAELLLYQQGIILDELITGTVSISDVMIVTILVWEIGGTVLAATQR